MSTAQIEYGTIKFTKTGYMEMVRHVRTVYNDFLDSQYQFALQVFELAKTKGLKSPSEVNDKLLTLVKVNYLDTYRIKGSPSSTKALITDHELFSINQELFRGKNNALCKPRKSAFKRLTNKDVSFSMDCDCGTLTFNSDHQYIHWYVSENNHSVDSSHEHTLASTIFNFLDNDYKWKRGEGGSFNYWDEYMTCEEEDDERDLEPECRTTSTSREFGANAPKQPKRTQRFHNTPYRVMNW